MAKRFKLTSEADKAIGVLISMLSEILEDQRSNYDDRSEQWQEGDVAANVMEWI